MEKQLVQDSTTADLCFPLSIISNSSSLIVCREDNVIGLASYLRSADARHWRRSTPSLSSKKWVKISTQYLSCIWISEWKHIMINMAVLTSVSRQYERLWQTTLLLVQVSVCYVHYPRTIFSSRYQSPRTSGSSRLWKAISTQKFHPRSRQIQDSWVAGTSLLAEAL